MSNVQTSMTVVKRGEARSAGSFLMAAANMQRLTPTTLEKETAKNMVTLTKAEKVKAWTAKGPAILGAKALPFQIFTPLKS